MSVRVRFAPSPTGNLHIGSVRTALFNWLFAKHHQKYGDGGQLILRIEDTDKERSTKEFEKDILEGLQWLGLDWNEGPLKAASSKSKVKSPEADDLQLKTYNNLEINSYYQSERTEIYQKYIKKLLDEGKAYKDSASPAIYFKTPDSGETTINDAIKGPITFQNSEIKDQVILKSDGGVTYNFAVVIDDATMGITHVIRGEDHISNTPKQILMYQALRFDVPIFAHLPMILGPDRSKLSKRHGATSVNEYRKQGFLPEAIVNYLALLGWTPEDGTEIMGTEELIKKFSLGRVSKSNSIFDIDKLMWMNGERIKKIPTAELADICKPYLSEENQEKIKNNDWFFQLLDLVRDGISVFSDINTVTKLFFEDTIEISDDTKKFIESAEAKTVLSLLKNKLAENSNFSPESIDKDINAVLNETGLGKGKVLKPIRIAVTGRQSGPALKDTLFLLGKEVCLERLSSLV